MFRSSCTLVLVYNVIVHHTSLKEVVQTRPLNLVHSCMYTHTRERERERDNTHFPLYNTWYSSLKHKGTKSFHSISRYPVSELLGLMVSLGIVGAQCKIHVLITIVIIAFVVSKQTGRARQVDVSPSTKWLPHHMHTQTQFLAQTPGAYFHSVKIIFTL